MPKKRTPEEMAEYQRQRRARLQGKPPPTPRLPQQDKSTFVTRAPSGAKTHPKTAAPTPPRTPPEVVDMTTAIKRLSPTQINAILSRVNGKPKVYK